MVRSVRVLFSYNGETFESIGEFLKDRRLQLNMTQSYLAEECKISQQSITYYESNKRIPSEKVLLSFSNVLMVEFSKLIEMKTLTELRMQINNLDLDLNLDDYIIRIEPKNKGDIQTIESDLNLKRENRVLANRVLELENIINEMKSDILNVLKKY